jgi:tetratricopeptide (TPR) repeat protein
MKGLLYVFLSGWVIALAADAAAAQATASKPPSFSELERRVAADSNDPALQVQFGRALLEKGRHDDAERRFREAVRISPGLAEAYLGLSAVPYARDERYWKRREKEQGRESVLSAWNEADNFSRLAFLLDPLVNPGLMPRAVERVTLDVDGMRLRVWWVYPLTKAINDFRRQKFKDAKRRLEKLLEDPASGEDGAGLPYDALWLHGLATAHLSDFQQAAANFTLLMNRAAEDAQSMPELNPMAANDYRYFTAAMMLRAGQYDLASLLFRQALENDPSLFMAHSQLARIHEHTGRWDEAIAERQRAMGANPDNSDLILDLGFTLLLAGKPEEALEVFRQAEKANLRDHRAPYQVGLIAFKLGRHDIARTSLGRFLTLAPARLATEIADSKRHLERLK